MYTEKNKLAPSNYTVNVVLDKKFGIDPIISEYWFMSNMSKWEFKYTDRKPEKLVYPLAITVEGRSKVVNIYDPKTKKVIKKSDKFTEKNFYEKYYTDKAFKEIFDEAVELSVTYRIKVAYFRENINGIVAPDIAPLNVEEALDPVVETAMIQEESMGFNVDADTGEILD